MNKEVNTPPKHAWKACNRLKRFGGSNPPHSASFIALSQHFTRSQENPQNVAKCGKMWQNVAKKTTIDEHVSLHIVHIIPQLARSRVKNDGTVALRFAVNYRSKTAYIPVGISLRLDQWHDRQVVKHPAAATLNSHLRAMRVQLEAAALDIMQNGEHHGLDARGVRDLIINRITPHIAEEPTLNEVIAEIIAGARRDGTAGVYRSTLSRLQQYEQRPLRFVEITPQWLQDFDEWLASHGTPSKNARNIHLRNIRRAFNLALNERRTEAAYPFRNFTIKPEPTPPAAYTAEELQQLFAATELSEMEAYWLDMFKLSFCLVGINLADLWQLQRVSRGRINYTRQKTGRRYSVEVLPAAAEIIRGHRANGEALLDICERYRNTHTAVIAANKHLQRIAERLGLPWITWYTARYSWASIAAALDIPIETISLALGHTYGRAVTLGYISPDARKADRANRAVINAVMG